MKDCRISLVISLVLESKGLTEMVYGHIFPLLLLQKYPGKWGYTWREMDEYGRRWNKQDYFLTQYIYIFMFCIVG